MSSRRQAVVALIRGINLGPHKKVSMPALREALESRGYDSVRTHLNSGNVVVVGTATPAAVSRDVKAAILETAGVTADVIVRTTAELAAAIDADPLAGVATNGSKHFLGFGTGPISGAVPTAETGPDLADFSDGHLYLWCPNGLSKSEFFAIDWTKQVGVAVTLRNWNTVTRLLQIARDELATG